MGTTTSPKPVYHKLEFYWLVLLALLIGTFFTLDAVQGHYNDKGYRYCMHVLSDKNTTPDTINACTDRLVKK